MVTTRRWMLLTASLSLFAGCASAPYKPAGFSRQDVTRKLNDLRFTCESLRMGTPVNVKFYQANIDPRETVAGGNLTGYLYGCNKMNSTISVSQKPLTWRDRGDAYYLQYVDEITPVQETALLPAKKDEPAAKSILNILKVKDQDPERQLLNQ